MVLNLIFTVIHKMIKEAEDFATIVRVAAKNAGSYVSLIKFPKNQAETFKKLTHREGTFLSSA